MPDPAAEALRAAASGPDGRPRLGVLSRTIAAMPLLGFMPELEAAPRLWKPLVHLPLRTGAARRAGVGALAGWGIGRRRAERVRALARRERVGYVALEDGFLRSPRPGPAEPAASLVADPVGVYYDATRPSLLEMLLQDGGWESAALRARAEAGIGLMRRLRLTKYALTQPPDAATAALLEAPHTLILDQRRGDMSIALGGGATDPEAADALFAAMLRAAIAERPGARPIVKVHPDALTGRHAGHLAGAAQAAGAALIATPVDPWALTARAEAVYTVSSLMGFEALMAGRPVRCFGHPFYAGWGATGDERPHPRRTRRRDVADIFAAAYLLYARYVDVATGAPCAFEDAAHDLARRRAAACGGAEAR